jgi:hypothetical protein
MSLVDSRWTLNNKKNNMKKLFFFFAAAMMAGSMMAQTALQNYNVSLGENEKWKVPTTNPFEEREEAIATDYANQIKSSALFRAMGGESVNEYDIMQFMSDLSHGDVSDYSSIFGSIGHKLIQNKRFRDFLADRICALLKDMCRLYPASTKKTILNLIDEVISVTDQMELHKYELADGEELQKDGKIIIGRTREELNVIYSWEGFFARRMLIDNISLSEIRGYLQTARKAVADEDVSHKPEYVACYTVNNDLKVVQATDRVFCRFRNGKQEDGVSSVTYLHDATGTYYKILGPYIWQDYDGRWQCVATSTLYDSDGNTIYTEVIPRD